VAVLLSTWCSSGCAERRPIVLGLSTATETMSILAVVLLIGGWWSGLALATAVSVVAVPLELIDASHSWNHRSATAVAYFIAFSLCVWVHRGESPPTDRVSTRSTPAASPPEVRGWERAGWLLAIVVIGVHGAFLVSDVMSARTEQQDFVNARVVEAVVIGGGTTDRPQVVFTDPDTREAVELTIPVWSVTSPSNDQTVAIELPPGNPGTARLLGDRFQWNSNLSGYPTPIALGLALAIGRTLHRRRLQRLQRTDDSAGSVTVRTQPGWRRGGRSRLLVLPSTADVRGIDERTHRVRAPHQLRCPPQSPIVILPAPVQVIGQLEPFHAARFDRSGSDIWPTARLRARTALWHTLHGRIRRVRSAQRWRSHVGPNRHELGLTFGAGLLGPTFDPDGQRLPPAEVLVSEMGIGRLDPETDAPTDVLSWGEVAPTLDAPDSSLSILFTQPPDPSIDALRALIIAIIEGQLRVERLSDPTWTTFVVARFTELGPAWRLARSPGWHRVGRRTNDALTASGLAALGRPWRSIQELPIGLIERIDDDVGCARSLIRRPLNRRDIAEELARAMNADPWPYTSCEE
jgi:hypothetical protein